MGEHIALLRGINVGGNNVIRMADLKACFEDMGFFDVRTYIQSGNVLFRAADGVAAAKLVAKIEGGLARRFDYDSRVVVRSRDELAAIVSGAPADFGGDDLHRWYVVFIREPATAAEVLAAVTPRPGVDRATPGDGVVYFETLISAASRSSLTRVIGTPVYQSMTIRNWNTTVKLREISADGDGPKRTPRAGSPGTRPRRRAKVSGRARRGAPGSP